MRCPAQVNRAVHQQQADALRVAARVKRLQAITGKGSSSRVGGLYLGWSSAQLRTGCQVKRVQPLVVVAARVLGHADDKDASVRPITAIDDWRRRNSNLGSDLAAIVIIAGRLVGAQHRDLP